MTIRSVVRNMPASDYHAVPACSQTFLKKLSSHSPKHAMCAMGKESTASMAFGSAAHTMILEPGEFCNRYVVLPELDLRTKAGKAERDAILADNPGKMTLSADDHERLKAMRDAVDKSVAAVGILSCADAEVSLFWDHSRLGVPCKARLDAWNEDARTIVDLKTCTDASHRAWMRSMIQYGYDRQAAWYLSGAAASGLEPDMFVRFVFLCVETEAPYGVALYDMDADYIEAAQALNDDALKDYAECAKSGQWHGYPDEIQTLTCPPWMGNGFTE